MKIVIIGAGPIGCYSAQLFNKFMPGIDVINIEEHPQVGKPVHCAGLVSRRIFEESKVALDTGCIINVIDGARFFFNSDSFLIRRKDAAVVVDRSKFDADLSRGLKIISNTRFVGIGKEGRGYLIETDKGEYYADIVIGADGANSLLRSAINGKENIDYFRGVQFRIRSKRKRNIVNVYIRSSFFAWAIPEDENIIRVGIISDNPYHDLVDLLRREGIKGEILEKFAGVVPLGRCQTQKDRIFLVGDAACQVKPLSHGGLYYGMRCAEILVDCISQSRLDDYQKKWQERFGREINIGLKIRQIYTKLNQDNIDKMFAIFKENVDIIEKFGDLENHSKFISEIIKNPKLQILLGKVIFSIIKDINTQ
mgnify:CR=1 FL=1